MCFAPQRRAIFGQLKLGFLHFDLQMCFSLQRRAIFLHPNFKKCSEADVFCTFSVANMLLATAACNFWTAQLQKVLRSWCFVRFELQMCFLLQRRSILRHLNFQSAPRPSVFFAAFLLDNVLRATAACNFSMSPLNTCLRTRRFSEPSFRPSRHTNHWKNIEFCDFPNISRVCFLFLLSFAQLYLLSSDSTSLLCFSSSDSTFLLCFSTLHIVGSFTSKRPLTRSWQSMRKS